MLRESLKDAGDIVQNILTQRLVISGTEEELSLLEAANIHLESNGTSSLLLKVLETLQQYPEATQMLFGELQLLSNELKHQLKS